MVFAFKVSIPDLIKKLFYRYRYDIDFVDNFISRIYHPGERIEISLDRESIEIRSPGTIDDGLFRSIQKKDIMTIASVIPPILDYKNLSVSFGNMSITTGEDRKPKPEILGNSIEGSIIRIERTNADIGNEKSRLKDLYSLSDMEVILNGDIISPDQEKRFGFMRGTFRGTISYNPKSLGGINYFTKGRFVSDERLINGIDICLFEHPFPTTITKSKTITKRDKKHQELMDMMPDLLVMYINSDKAKALADNGGNGSSYQTLLRLVYNQYSEHTGIKDAIKRNIRFFDKDGNLKKENNLSYVTDNLEVELANTEESLYYSLTDWPRLTFYESGELRCSRLAKTRQLHFGLLSSLSINNVRYENTDTPSFDKNENILTVPHSLVEESGSLFEALLGVLPYIGMDENRKLELYKMLVDKLR